MKYHNIDIYNPERMLYSEEFENAIIDIISNKDENGLINSVNITGQEKDGKEFNIVIVGHNLTYVGVQYD